MPVGSVAWNFARTLMTVKDTSTSISTFKEKLKKHLLCKQALGMVVIGLIPTKKLIKFGFQKYVAIKLHGNLKKEIKQSIAVYLFIYYYA